MYSPTDLDWELSAKMRKSLGNFVWNANPNDNARPHVDLEDESTWTECWPAANNPGVCGNDLNAFVYRFGRSDDGGNGSPFLGTDFALGRCLYWESDAIDTEDYTKY